jgi:RNA polymerase sigma-70 factor, ECF subfamily
VAGHKHKGGFTNPDLTSIRVRSALDGDHEARDWIVRRLSPLLLAQARYRMGRRLQRFCDPEDLVADVWQRAIPRLTAELRPTEGRCTPVLVSFLSGIVINRINELIREMIRQRGDEIRSGGPSGNESGPERFRAPGEAVWRRLLVHDDVRKVLEILDELDPQDQEIIILRKVEGVSSKIVARRLDVATNVINTRLSRALARLRERIPEGVFDELNDEGA